MDPVGRHLAMQQMETICLSGLCNCKQWRTAGKSRQLDDMHYERSQHVESAMRRQAMEGGYTAHNEASVPTMMYGYNTPRGQMPYSPAVYNMNNLGMHPR